MLHIEFSIFSNENIKKVALSATTTRHWERRTSNQSYFGLIMRHYARKLNNIISRHLFMMLRIKFSKHWMSTSYLGIPFLVSNVFVCRFDLHIEMGQNQNQQLTLRMAKMIIKMHRPFIKIAFYRISMLDWLCFCPYKGKMLQWSIGILCTKQPYSLDIIKALL